MSGCVGLQLAAAKRQNEALIEPTTVAAVAQSRISGLHAYQRQRQQQLQQQRLLQQQPQQIRQQQQQQQEPQLQHHQLQSHRHQQPQQEPSQQPPEAAATNTTTTITTTNIRLAAVQSKRKEKARIAARARRSQEASIIMEMAGELSIGQEKLRRIDKATIVKLAIDYIRAHGALCNSAPAASLCSQTKQLKNSHNNHINEQRQRQSIQSQLQHIYDDNDYYDNDDDDDDGRVDHERRLQRKTKQHHQQQPAGVAASSEVARPPPQPLQQQQQQQQQQPQPQPQPQPLYSAPKLATTSIFAPKTVENMNPHFLMIEENDTGKGAFVLKPDTEILDEDDLTHLAPQAGDISISLEVEPLEGILLEDLLIPSPTSMVQQQQQQQLWMR